MKTRFPSIERIGVFSGLLTGFAMILYFLLMQAVGYGQVLELRFVNFAILAVGICVAISKYKHDLHNRDFYLQGWGQGIYTTIVAMATFAAFMTIYLTQFNQDLYKYINENGIMGRNITGLHIFFALMMEGTAAGFVITLSAMQYFKTNGTRHHNTPNLQ